MNYGRVQCDIIKALEKNRSVENYKAGIFIEYDGYVWVMNKRATYGVAIPKPYYHLSIPTIKSDELERQVTVVKDKGELVKYTKTTEECGERIARVFQFENGTKYYVDEKLLKEFKGYTEIYAVDSISMGLVYENGYLIGFVYPLWHKEID